MNGRRYLLLIPFWVSGLRGSRVVHVSKSQHAKTRNAFWCRHMVTTRSHVEVRLESSA
jgi:hypothetical protein